MSRLLPVVPLVVGLVLTGFVASRTANSLDAEQREARELSSARLVAVADDVEHILLGRANAVRTVANVVAETATQPADDASQVEGAVDGQLAALGAFDPGSPILGVYAQSRRRVLPFTADGAVLSRSMPTTIAELSGFESGLWADAVAYGVDAGGSSQADVVVLIDPNALIAEGELRDEFDVRLIGLPGSDVEPTETTNFRTNPDGVLVEGDAQIAVLTRTTTFLDQPLSIEVTGDERTLWEPSSNSVAFILAGGALLSLALATIIFFMVRSLDRAALERDQADAEREAAAARFHASFTHAPIGVVELEGDGRIVAANPRFASQLGYALDELEGMDILDLVDGEDRPAANARLDDIFDGDVDSDQAERRYRTRNGAAVWVRESTSALASQDGDRHVLVQAEDISDERRARAELHRKALFDDLTGLPNRANLIARLNRAVDGERGPGEMMAVMFVDLDEFKQVNDTLGHEAGDMLLVEVAERLRRACRSSDTVARLGGDEFVVVCEGLPNDEVAQQAAERFAESLREPMFIRDIEVPVSASIGLVVNSDESEPEAILRQADQAMYRAKTSGRNQLVRYDITTLDGIDRRSEERPEVTDDELQKVVDAGQLRLHYQPIVRSADQSIVGLEALVRWQHPEHGLLTPPDFLARAEELRIVEEIDAWVLQEGLDALARWSAESDEVASWYLAFNISPTNYNHRSFVDRVSGYLDDADISADRVVLERNETWFMTQTATAVVATRELRSLGVRISLDHFGTGSSSLTEVSTLEFDLLKIDRSFVRDASDHHNYVLEAIRSMADALGLKAIVEGVETEEELRVVRKSGIEFAQGFHFWRPMDEEALIREHLLGVPESADTDA